MLRIERLSVRYGAIQAVREVTFQCEPGRLASLVGPNGAGKSSVLRAIAGAAASAHVDGDVRLDGESVLRLSPEQRVAAGIVLVPEGRHIFASLSVAENLALGDGRRPGEWSVPAVLERFPDLADSRHRPAGLLSGGQQQQLAIGRALVANPRFLLCDEPSLGLAPRAIEDVFAILEELRRAGVGVLLVEQNAVRAVELADAAFALHKGEIERLGGEKREFDALLGRFREPTRTGQA